MQALIGPCKLGAATSEVVTVIALVALQCHFLMLASFVALESLESASRAAAGNEL